MPDHRRVLVVDPDPETMDRMTATLEGDAYIVTGTQSDGVALDLAQSSEFDALVISTGVPLSDRGYLVSRVRDRHPDLAVVIAQGPQSVLIQLRQAFKEKDSEKIR